MTPFPTNSSSTSPTCCTWTSARTAWKACPHRCAAWCTYRHLCSTGTHCYMHSSGWHRSGHTLPELTPGESGLVPQLPSDPGPSRFGFGVGCAPQPGPISIPCLVYSTAQPLWPCPLRPSWTHAFGPASGLTTHVSLQAAPSSHGLADPAPEEHPAHPGQPPHQPGGPEQPCRLAILWVTPWALVPSGPCGGRD